MHSIFKIIDFLYHFEICFVMHTTLFLVVSICYCLCLATANDKIGNILERTSLRKVNNASSVVLESKVSPSVNAGKNRRLKFMPTGDFVSSALFAPFWVIDVLVKGVKYPFKLITYFKRFF